MEFLSNRGGVDRALDICRNSAELRLCCSRWGNIIYIKLVLNQNTYIKLNGGHGNFPVYFAQKQQRLFSLIIRFLPLFTNHRLNVNFVLLQSSHNKFYKKLIIIIIIIIINSKKTHFILLLLSFLVSSRRPFSTRLTFAHS
jgi:hypothetical protein